MGFELTIHFTGLCGFVKPTADTMRAVLVNAFDGMMHDKHCACFLLDRKFHSGGRGYDFGFDGTKGEYGSTDMLGFILEDEDFTISSAAGTLNIIDVPLESACPGDDKFSIQWMAQMADVGSGKMKKAAFRGRNPALVRARMDITNGRTFFNRLFALDNDKITPKVLKWDVDGNPGNSRALGEVVTLVMDISSATATLTSTKTGGNIVLAPFASKAEVWLVNQPLEDIILDRKIKPRGADVHFVHYYDLSVSPGTHIPSPTGEDCGPPPSGGVSNPRCPVSFFNSFET